MKETMKFNQFKRDKVMFFKISPDRLGRDLLLVVPWENNGRRM